MTEQRRILHIDMDAFFASVEQMDNPKLSGRPVIVGGTPQGRGVVAACSYEARKFGIHSAMSAARAIRRCPHALFVRPRKGRYKEVSIQIMEIFRSCSPCIEPLSVDEAFLDITESHDTISAAAETAEHIRSRVFHEVGLTCSAGVSYNKFLAKIASDMNKPDGLTIIPPEQAKDFIASLPIGKFYGVGKVTEKKMHSLGIRTGQDLLRFRKSELVRFFGKAGRFFYDIARGVDDRPVQVSRGRKSIGTETTLQTDLLDLKQIREVIENLALRVERALKNKECGGTTITLKVRYHDFTTVTRSLTLPAPLHTFEEIIQHIPQLLGATDAGKTKIRLLGITVSNLSCESKTIPVQLQLPFS
ncbi:MAG TPA: DNA polymerase IV [Desulfobacterales bacterium]|nr:DNA polymerase IV [Desulfobacterales bacterium]HIP38075.1 DNA polymerase IV [Desulfocapsa sulfexigens]